MRTTFAKTLTEVAQRDQRVLLLTADLGYMALETFSDTVPDQFYNVGVAEQNMIGIATGLAEAGYVPFVYSIAPFASLRPIEFLRNGPVLHELPVRVVGVGAGFEYGTAGPTHHGIDDAASLRPLLGLTIISPADARQTRTALLGTWDHPGPMYFRIGKDEKIEVPGLDGRFRLGRAEIVREGHEVAIVSMGAVTVDAVAAAETLTAAGISTTVVVVSSFNPSPCEELAEVARAHSLVVTMEAQVVVGALGSLMAEVIADGGIGTKLIRLGVRRPPQSRSGSQAYYHAVHGLRPEDVATLVRNAFAGKGT